MLLPISLGVHGGLGWIQDPSIVSSIRVCEGHATASRALVGKTGKEILDFDRSPYKQSIPFLRHLHESTFRQGGTLERKKPYRWRNKAQMLVAGFYDGNSKIKMYY
jgi:hypothetical protein